MPTQSSLTETRLPLGSMAPDFSLPATDGKTYSLSDVKGENGTVVVFICNHCPYVLAVISRMIETANALSHKGIGFVAICSNNAETHPADSFDNMAVFAQSHQFSFPYLHDESQDVARAYDAVCTPDFFGLDAQGNVKYRGRLDEGRTQPLPAGAACELYDAMVMIADTGTGPEVQYNSVGCGIKWKD